MKKISLAMVVLFACGAAQAASEDVEMHLVTPQGIGQSIGEVEIEETDNGLKFTPRSESAAARRTRFSYPR